MTFLSLQHQLLQNAVQQLPVLRLLIWREEESWSGGGRGGQPGEVRSGGGRRGLLTGQLQEVLQDGQQALVGVRVAQLPADQLEHGPGALGVHMALQHQPQQARSCDPRRPHPYPPQN